MEPSYETLLGRIESLEERLTILQQRIDAVSVPSEVAQPESVRTSPAREFVTVVEKPRRKSDTQPSPSFSLKDRFPWTTEDSLKWAGIALVLFAVGFFFKYAIDEGWLTPAVRVVLGLLLGFVLVGLGFYARSRRPGFGQVLQGGGVATFYITLFASSQVLTVVPYGMAFAGMVLVTAFALALGLYHGDPPLAVLGLIGGLATPFLLYTPEGSITGLVVYVLILLTATTGIYLFWGWRSMLYTTVVGGWGVFLMAASDLPYDRAAQMGDRLALQIAAGFALLSFWAVPVCREWLVRRNPDFWPSPALTAGSRFIRGLEKVLRNAVHQLTLLVPPLALLLTGISWRLEAQSWGLIAVGMAAVLIGVAELLRRQDVRGLAYTHRWSALLVASLAIPALLEEEAILVAFAVEATALHFLAYRQHDRFLRGYAHFVWLIPGFWLLAVLGEGTQGPPPFVTWDALRPLAVILLGLASGFAVRLWPVRVGYWLAAHVALLALIYRELLPFEGGQAFVTALWTFYAIALLVAGLRLDRSVLRTGGLMTLALVVGKLFLVDLRNLDPLWRILLFLGVGALFLLVAYFVPNLWKREKVEG